MKKYMALIFTLLFIFCFTSCNTKSYDAYTSFITNVANDGYSVPVEIHCWTGAYFEKKHMAGKTCHVLGKSYSGSYRQSIVDKWNSYITDIYTDENGVEFGLRSDTGKLVYMNLMNRNFFDTQPYLPEVNQPVETAISLATEIASKNVDHIEDYTQILEEEEREYEERGGVTYKITYYQVTFAKKINGYLTSDYITVIVTSKGTLASIMMGDINAFAGISIVIDTADVDQSIFNKVESAYSAYKESRIRVEKSYIEDQRLVLTPDGDICIYSWVVVQGVDKESDTEVQTGVVILTTLGQKAK